MGKMTAADMVYNTRLIYEDIASMAAPGITPPEWSVKLTQAQEIVLRDIHEEGMDRNETTRRIFSTIIRSAVIPQANITAPGIFPNAYLVDIITAINNIGDDYWFALTEHANTAVGTNLRVVSRQWSEVLQNVTNPYKMPYDDMYWKVTYDGNTLIITDGEALISLRVNYIRKPYPIIVPDATNTTSAMVGYYYFPSGDSSTSFPLTEGWSVVPNTSVPEVKQVKANTGQDCELDGSIHLKICETAASLIYKSIKDVNGFQLQNAETK